jgi:hypothetical protein
MVFFCFLIFRCALDWNENAIAFYKGMGAITMDGWSTFRLAGDALAKVAAE